MDLAWDNRNRWQGARGLKCKVHLGPAAERYGRLHFRCPRAARVTRWSSAKTALKFWRHYTCARAGRAEADGGACTTCRHGLHVHIAVAEGVLWQKAQPSRRKRPLSICFLMLRDLLTFRRKWPPSISFPMPRDLLTFTRRKWPP